MLIHASQFAQANLHTYTQARTYAQIYTHTHNDIYTLSRLIYILSYSHTRFTYVHACTLTYTYILTYI